MTDNDIAVQMRIYSLVESQVRRGKIYFRNLKRVSQK